MVIERTASLLPGSTILTLSPSGRMAQACVPALRSTTRPGLAGCGSTIATTVS